MIIEVKGDVFWSGSDILVHGCNCFCAMGAGIAKQVKELYPGAWEVDQETLWGDKNKLGTYTLWEGRKANHPSYNIKVINAYTQYKYTRNKIDADYNAIEKVMRKIQNDFPEDSISMPRIGAGLAGGDWNKIKEILYNIFEDTSNLISIYYL